MLRGVAQRPLFSSRHPALILELLGTQGRYTDTGATSPASSGNAVAAWKDLAGAGYSAIQGSSAQRPLATSLGLSFDGADDKLDIAHNVAFYVQAGFAYRAWVRASASTTKVVFGRDNFGAQREWALFTNHNGSSGTLTCNVYNSSNSAYNASVALPTTPDTWVHIACTFDGLRVRAYLNANAPNVSGADVPAGTLTPGYVQATRIGDSLGGSRQFVGQLGGLWIYQFGASLPADSFWSGFYNAERSIFSV